MTPLAWCLALVVAQRSAELVLARRNTASLLARGGVEHGAAHYPLIVALHAGWLAALAIVVPWDRPPSWPWLGLFIAMQPVRLWILASLGPRWTTRIIVMPGDQRVRRGPYRWLRHPNYLLVAIEIFALPAAFGAWTLAIAASLLNAALLLLVRIPAEERALASEATTGGTAA